MYPSSGAYLSENTPRTPSQLLILKEWGEPWRMYLQGAKWLSINALVGSYDRQSVPVSACFLLPACKSFASSNVRKDIDYILRSK